MRLIVRDARVKERVHSQDAARAGVAKINLVQEAFNNMKRLIELKLNGSEKQNHKNRK